MRTWRLIADSGAGAAEGLALDEALMRYYGRDEHADCEATLRLYSYQPHCALVGRYQDLEAEVDLAACERLGLQVARRPTGGGAIIMGPDQLGVAVATRAPSGIGPRDLLRQYAGGIVAGLAGLGIDARFRGKNDLEVDGRKIAGLGLYVDERGALLFHASVLADLDVELMLTVLRIPGAKLADKGAERVHERITTAALQTRRRMTADDLREPIAHGFRELLGIELARSEPDERERERAGELLAERYATRRWTAGRTLGAGARGTAACKTAAGFLRVYAATQGDTLSSVLLAGDFSVMPSELLALESALKWCRADPQRIAAVVRRELDGAAPELDPDTLAAGVWSAAERALARSSGASPVRPEGSCYFPEAPGAVPD